MNLLFFTFSNHNRWCRHQLNPLSAFVQEIEIQNDSHQASIKTVEGRERHILIFFAFFAYNKSNHPVYLDIVQSFIKQTKRILERSFQKISFGSQWADFANLLKARKTIDLQDGRAFFCRAGCTFIAEILQLEIH